jgi:MOSC domain-containing protein YiiM
VLAVLAVFVGRQRVIGEVRGRPVESGIAKARTHAPSLDLGEVNLAGDGQADLSVHGGPDKAVYVYPSEHYATWQQAGFAVEVGGLGENVALAGATEHDVRLGDVWRWGGALVQVSQPRAPCYKLALHTGRKDAGAHMQATGHSGWYLRVLETGTVPTSGNAVLEHRDEGEPTVHEAVSVMFHHRDDDGDVLARVLRSRSLAEGWRAPLVARRGEVRT